MKDPKTAPILKAEPKGAQRELVILLLSSLVHSETHPEVRFFFSEAPIAINGKNSSTLRETLHNFYHRLSHIRYSN